MTQIFAGGLQIAWFPELLLKLQQQETISNHLDFEKVGVAGHSRGGKIAALLYASKGFKAHSS